MCVFCGLKFIETCCFCRSVSIEKHEGTPNAFVKNEDYHVKKAYVLSNTREITTNGKVTYIPIYDLMFWGVEESATKRYETILRKRCAYSPLL